MAIMVLKLPRFTKAPWPYGYGGLTGVDGSIIDKVGTPASTVSKEAIGLYMIDVRLASGLTERTLVPFCSAGFKELVMTTDPGSGLVWYKVLLNYQAIGFHKQLSDAVQHYNSLVMVEAQVLERGGDVGTTHGLGGLEPYSKYFQLK